MNKFHLFCDRITGGDIEKFNNLYAKYQHHKGWLGKKSTSIMHTFQERYFIISNLGHQLAYFYDDKVSSKPQGAIDIALITEIKQMTKKTFILVYPGRDFELKAKSPEECEGWITALNFAKVKLMNSNELKAEQLKQLASQKRQSQKGWKIIDQQVFQNIAQEKETEVIKEKEEEHSSDEEKSQKKRKSAILALPCNDLFNQTGIESYLKGFSRDFIENRVVYGPLAKRTKGKVKKFVKRWFLLISAKPLYQSVYNDEMILQETSLPAYMELDTIFQFGMNKEDQFRPKNGIKMLDCQEIIVKDMQKSKESGYSFKINLGERIYQFMTQTESERMRWYNALKTSANTTKEINNPQKIVLTKNIDIIVSIYDEEQSLMSKREKLKTKIEHDIERIKFDVLKDSDYLQNLENLINFLNALYSDMLAIMKACIVKDPPRRDIIWEYTEYLHEKICDIITRFWDKNHENLQGISLLTFANWFVVYEEKVKEFFQDDRLKISVATLLEIYINRSLDSCEDVVQEIIEHETHCQPTENEDQLLVSNSPYDLFKIINEGIDHAFKKCPVQETCFKLGYFAKSLIQNYQAGLVDILDGQASQEKRISICNNTLSLIQQTDQVYKRLQAMGKFSDEEMERVFNKQQLNKKFFSLSENSREVFFEIYFEAIPTHFKSFYLELKIQDILQSLIVPAHKQLQQLHDSFSRKIWKELLEIFVLFYFNCLIISCNKAKNSHLQFFLQQLDQDKEFLQAEFSNFLFDSQINLILSPFKDMSDLLTGESVSILEPCQNLRKYFGPSFTVKTIKTIMSIRTDMSKERKKETIEACSDMIHEYNVHNPHESNKTSRFLTVLGMEENEEQEEEAEEVKVPEKKTFNKMQTMKKTKTMRMSITMADVVNVQEEYIEEGFLLKRRLPKQTKNEVVKVMQSIMVIPQAAQYDSRYFRLKKGKLYWYINESSREAQNKIDLHQVDEVQSDPARDTRFVLVVDDGRNYEFKTDTKEIRDMWVRSLIREQKNSDQVKIQKIEAIKTGAGKHLIIKDYDALARKERQRLKAEEKRQKRQEREDRKTSHGNGKKDSREANAMLRSIKGFDIQQKPAEKEVHNVGCCEGFLICLGLKRGYHKHENE